MKGMEEIKSGLGDKIKEVRTQAELETYIRTTPQMSFLGLWFCGVFLSSFFFPP